MNWSSCNCTRSYGDPVPMSLEEAMAYHSQPLAEYEIKSLAEYGDPVPVLSTTFETVEAEVDVEVKSSQAGGLTLRDDSFICAPARSRHGWPGMSRSPT